MNHQYICHAQYSKTHIEAGRAQKIHFNLNLTLLLIKGIHKYLTAEWNVVTLPLAFRNHRVCADKCILRYGNTKNNKSVLNNIWEARENIFSCLAKKMQQ